MKRSFLLLVLTCAVAYPRNRIGTEIAPIIGYELTQKTTPTAHTNFRLVYGGRIVWGHPLLSLETEVLLTSDTETFTGDPSSIEDDAIKAKIGLRGNFEIGKEFYLIARLGTEGIRNVNTSVTATGTVITYDAVVFDPYFGIGFSVELLTALFLDVDFTAVFVNSPTDFGTNDYQLTTALAYRFP